MDQRYEAKVIERHRYPTVTAFAGVEYTKKEYRPVPPHFVDQLPHPLLEERKMKMKASKSVASEQTSEFIETSDLVEVFGAKTAEALSANDIADSAAVAEMSDEELIALPGIGKATVKRIRKALE